MSSSKECREFADEYMGWAKTARSERGEPSQAVKYQGCLPAGVSWHS